VNGFLVPVKKHEEIAESIAMLLEDEKLYKKMAEKSREKALREFDIGIIIKKHIALYKKLLQ